jgi:predicted RNA methylase
MRKARDFFFGFDPQSFEEAMAIASSPQGAYVRMVLSYWDMAASFVENGAIDRKMFLDANGEFIMVFAKIERFLPQFREVFQNPGFGAHLEKLALSIPDARQRIDATLARVRAILAQARAAAAKA